MARKSKANRTVKINLAGIETRKRVAEGEYLITPIEIEKEKGAKGDYLAWKYEVAEGPSKGAVLFNNTSLAEKALWNLRNVLECHGIDIPEKAFNLDLDAIIADATPAGCEVIMESFEGKKRSSIADIFSAEDVDPDAQGEDDDTGGDEKRPTEDEIMEMDVDELEEAVDDFDLDVDLDDVKGKGKKKLAAQRKAVAEAMEEDDGGDVTFEKDDIMAMKSKELKALIEEHDLDVETDDVKLRVIRKETVKALDEADMLD